MKINMRIKDETKLSAIIISVPLVFMIVFFVSTKVKFKSELMPLEQRLYTYRSSDVVRISEKKPPVRVASLFNPITFPGQPGKGFPDVPLEDMAPKVSGMRVSFIMVGQDKKVAVVDGKLYKEGSAIGAGQIIAKIEKNRVLVKGKKGEVWLNQE